MSHNYLTEKSLKALVLECPHGAPPCLSQQLYSSRRNVANQLFGVFYFSFARLRPDHARHRTGFPEWTNIYYAKIGIKNV
jgi:hypothetical protein